MGRSAAPTVPSKGDTSLIFVPRWRLSLPSPFPGGPAVLRAAGGILCGPCSSLLEEESTRLVCSHGRPGAALSLQPARHCAVLL